VVGALLAARDLRQRGLDPEPLYAIGLIVTAAALVGGRAYYLAEHGELLEPSKWLGSRGFTFYGGLSLAALALAASVRRCGLTVRYLDSVAASLPLGLAVGRIGDVINGEHYGLATTVFLGVRNTHPGADVPDHQLAYSSGRAVRGAHRRHRLAAAAAAPPPGRR
jgi:phosphatidylglycerol:prolipoprotein diacylglycerol transferase